MAEQSSSPPPAAPAAPAAAPAGGLFISTTYPFDVAQALVDQTAYFPLYAVPERKHSFAMNSGAGQFGIEATVKLHRFQMHMNTPSQRNGVKAVNAVGESLGKANLQWLMAPDNFVVSQGVSPPATALNPSQSQRFTMLRCEFSFADGRDTFRCFGPGRTFPSNQTGGFELLAAASGDITEGTGIFHRAHGTCIFAGRLDPAAGFIGAVIVRVTDPDDKLTVEVIPSLERDPEIALEDTYFLFRGNKKDPAQTTQGGAPPAPGAGGFDLNQIVRIIYPDCGAWGSRGLRSSRQVGAIIGSQAASVHFDPSQLPSLSKPFASVPFKGENTFTFTDDSGNSIGSIHNITSDGLIYSLQLETAPRQQAIRIAGFGPLTGGTGTLSGVEGLFHSMAFTALPPTPSSLYIVRIKDPQGKYRE